MPTKIEWCDETWNPTRGCSRVSPGCTNCYAERQARRHAGKNGAYEGLLHSTGVWNGGITLVEGALDLPERWLRPRRIFVDSMSDLFHERVPFEFIDKVFETMITTPRHTYQVLTKRPERMLEYMSSSDTWPRRVTIDKLPPPNVWLGVSVEDQERAEERIPLLLQTPATLRFLSCEPLLGPLDLHAACALYAEADSATIDWIIVGGESGPGARPFVLGWGKELVRQCRAAHVAVFVKQVGAYPTNREGERCPHIKDRKGGNPTEWPEELRVREWPQ